MTRTFVMGDPQGPFDKVLAVLRRHALLDGDRLAADVVLVSIGDHFDFDYRDPGAGAEGLRLLRWLASHDPAQAVILLGNHDASRVMELAALSDEEFAIARACNEAEYAMKFAHLPPQHVLARDYASFSVEQRALVEELLVARRFHLAVVGELGGERALITHAGVTTRELALLGLPATGGAREIADALEAHLDLAIRRGTRPLSLEPLHRAGCDGVEGDGLLYHRPSAKAQPRRFDPRTLPGGLLQIVGHTGHAKCVHELGEWCTWRARERAHGGLRTLLVGGDVVEYDLGVAREKLRGLDAGMFGVWGAALIFVDGELRRVPVDEIDLLPIARVL